MHSLGVRNWQSRFITNSKAIKYGSDRLQLKKIIATSKQMKTKNKQFL